MRILNLNVFGSGLGYINILQHGDTLGMENQMLCFGNLMLSLPSVEIFLILMIMTLSFCCVHYH